MRPDMIASATIAVETPGEGFVEITRDVGEFVQAAGAGDGALFSISDTPRLLW
jgi:hypothetical protein